MSDDEVSRINDEVRVRWTGSARFDADQAAWAMRYAATFSARYATDKASRTGFRRCEFLTGPGRGRGVLVPGLDPSLHAYVYFTPSGVVVVRIHGDVGEVDV